MACTRPAVHIYSLTLSSLLSIHPSTHLFVQLAIHSAIQSHPWPIHTSHTHIHLSTSAYHLLSLSPSKRHFLVLHLSISPKQAPFLCVIRPSTESAPRVGFHMRSSSPSLHTTIYQHLLNIFLLLATSTWELSAYPSTLYLHIFSISLYVSICVSSAYIALPLSLFLWA